MGCRFPRSRRIRLSLQSSFIRQTVHWSMKVTRCRTLNCLVIPRFYSCSLQHVAKLRENHYGICIYIVEGSLEAKLPTIWIDGKAPWPARRSDMRRSAGRRSERDAGARKGRKVAETLFFPCFVASEGRRVGSLKRRVRSQLVR